MLADLAANFPVVEATFAEASAELGYDLWALVQNGPEEELNKTGRPSLHCWRPLWPSGVSGRKNGAMPAMMAGHSPGNTPRWCVPV